MGTVDTRELRRLHEAATPGPWEVYSHQSGSAEGCYVSVEADARGVLFDTLNAGSVRTIYSPEDNESGWFEEGESADNLRLAVAARNALPSLLDRLEAAEAEVARLREALGEVAESLKCHHPPDDGSDDSCGGEDCLKCMAREALEGR